MGRQTSAGPGRAGDSSDSTMPSKLTVIIPCKNEQRHMADCIKSARLVADEVLVADSGSTDRTRAIARELGCRVIEREYRTSGDFKNWAIPQAEGEWVMILDADERVTPEMAQEINSLFASGPQQDGYWVPRINHFLGKPLRYGSWRPSRLMRLFRRDLGRYIGETDHAEVTISTGRVGRLRTYLAHHTMWSYQQYLSKLNRYADVQAGLWHQAGRKSSFWQLLLRGPLVFLQDYVLRLGFLEGSAGLQAAVLVAYGSYLKQARLWELEHSAFEPEGELAAGAGIMPVESAETANAATTASAA